MQTERLSNRYPKINQSHRILLYKGGSPFLSKVSEKYCNKCGFMFPFCNVKHVLSIRCTDGGWGRTVERMSIAAWFKGQWEKIFEQKSIFYHTNRRTRL